MSDSLKLIFINTFPTSKLFGEKIDAWWFQENGFNVEFWDLGPLFWPEEKLKSYYDGADNYRYIGPTHRVFYAQQEVIAALRGLSGDACIWHLSRFYKNAEDDWIFRELHAKNIPYYLKHFGTESTPPQIGARLLDWARMTRQRFYNRMLHPQGIVGSGRLGRERVRQIFPAATFISIPSIKVRWQRENSIIEVPYNLFVDENIDYAPDAQLLGGYKICSNPDAYYARLNSFFDKVEAWSGKPVVIAASGKYHYPHDRFNGRKLIYGQTLPLIQNASLVLGHMSLALEQCLVSEIPVLTIDDPDFTEIKRKDFASSLIYLMQKPKLVTDISKSIYRDALVPDTMAMRQLVLDHLKEDQVAGDYYSIMKHAFMAEHHFTPIPA